MISRYWLMFLKYLNGETFLMDWEIGLATCVAALGMGSVKRVLGQFMDNFIIFFFFPEINNTWDTGVCKLSILRGKVRKILHRNKILVWKSLRRAELELFAGKKWGSGIYLSEERLSRVFVKNRRFELENDGLKWGPEHPTRKRWSQDVSPWNWLLFPNLQYKSDRLNMQEILVLPIPKQQQLPSEFRLLSWGLLSFTQALRKLSQCKWVFFTSFHLEEEGGTGSEEI